jgi:EAL domain-containing protein (putative c-di-GMP-specific phosphodiesterase class I)
MSDEPAPKDTLVMGAVVSQNAPAPNPAVLLVDDEQPILRAFERVLRSKGFDVVMAESGHAALELVMARRFGVIVSDINMPGMSGVELLQVVRAYDLDVPIILMTGVPTLETAMEAVRLGAIQYLPKPINNAELVAAVERGMRLHKIAQAKRAALELQGEEAALPGDLAGLRASFDRALETMWMAFQPIVDEGRKRIFAYEALMRSKEPTLPHPGAVLDAAEKLGRVRELGRHVRALSARAFADRPGEALLFVNLHAEDLLDDALFDRESPLGAISKTVVLEITERAALDEIQDIQRRVMELRRFGYRIAIDDLGAGYAGLSSFVALEPEFVKLDMSLVRGVHESMTRQRLIGTMTSLCTDLDMRVIAEGVEVAAERDGVSRLGCHLLQGYFFAKPGPPFPGVDGML